MRDSQKILVTGAAGRLGARVSELLLQEGYDILATDIIEPENATFPLVKTDLRNHEKANKLLQGIDTLIHLGNHPGMMANQPQILFNDNMSINHNMFQGAAELGVKRIIFISTLQLIGTHIDERTVKNIPQPVRYPMDGDTPADPSNVYALSKTLSERMLRYYAERCEIDCVALRFPLIHNNEAFAEIRADEASFTLIQEGFTGITYDDTVSLIISVLRADLPGYRVYAAGTAHRCKDLKIPELLEHFYPDLPKDLEDMIDISRITEETGWTYRSSYRPRRNNL